jgi:hypothetical protein
MKTAENVMHDAYNEKKNLQSSRFALIVASLACELAALRSKLFGLLNSDFSSMSGREMTNQKYYQILEKTFLHSQASKFPGMLMLNILCL